MKKVKKTKKAVRKTVKKVTKKTTTRKLVARKKSVSFLDQLKNIFS